MNARHTFTCHSDTDIVCLCHVLQLDCSGWQHHIAHALGAAAGRTITPSLAPLSALFQSRTPEEVEQDAQQAQALVDAVPCGMSNRYISCFS